MAQEIKRLTAKFAENIRKDRRERPRDLKSQRSICSTHYTSSVPRNLALTMTSKADRAPQTLSRRALGPILANSARTAIAAASSFLIARLSGLPEPYWAAITTLVVMQSTLGATLKVSGDRFVGTFLGAVSGGVLAYCLPQSWWAFGAGVFVLGVLCALFQLQYAYRFAGITLAIVMLIPHNAPTWIIALHRFIEVSIGIAAGLAVTAAWREPTQSGD